MKFHIETERLLLREFRESDMEDFYQMDSIPEVHKFLGNNPTQSREQALGVIHFIQKQYVDNGIGRWVAIEKSSGKFIGWSGLKLITEAENNHINYYDVGYRLHPDFWGKGYATESGKAAIQYGFENFGVDRIVGTCHENNKASRNALQKCGLRFVEKFTWHTLPCDWLEISRENWEANTVNQVGQ